LHKSTQQVRTQGPIRHADCRQRKLADFLCTGGIIQGLISAAHRAIWGLASVKIKETIPA
ncbi:MFS transporter, partial [Escherichia coli]